MQSVITAEIASRFIADDDDVRFSGNFCIKPEKFCCNIR